jgi:hypothetical protein
MKNRLIRRRLGGLDPIGSETDAMLAIYFLGPTKPSSRGWPNLAYEDSAG